MTVCSWSEIVLIFIDGFKLITAGVYQQSKKKIPPNFKCLLTHVKVFINNFRSKCKQSISGGNDDKIIINDNKEYIIEEILKYDIDNRLVNIGNIIMKDINNYYNNMISIKYKNISKNIFKNINENLLKNIYD